MIVLLEVGNDNNSLFVGESRNGPNQSESMINLNNVFFYFFLELLPDFEFGRESHHAGVKRQGKDYLGLGIKTKGLVWFFCNPKRYLSPKAIDCGFFLCLKGDNTIDFIVTN